MYKILVKYISTLGKTFWQSYEMKQEDGEYKEFSTDDLDELKEVVGILVTKYGSENLRIINDISYMIAVVLFDDIENVTQITSEDIQDIYSEAFNKVFTD